MDVHGRTILLVEDEALIAMTESLMLEKHGYRVVSVPTGEAAVEQALGPGRFDLILMDINLGPGMDGTRAAERILQSRDIPLVFLSSHTEPEVVRKTEGITSYGYIVKNSGETVLLASIRMAFMLHESRMREARTAAEREQMLAALRSLAESGLDAGEDIFRFIARQLAKVLGTKYALVARIETGEPERAHTLAVWNGDGYAENFTYDLEATPCRNVARQGACLYPREVVYRFPEDSILKEMGAESYWGTPLRSRGGEVLGILAVLDVKPMEEHPWFLSLLESFAFRAAGELERLRSERLLEEKENHLAATLSSIGDAVISTDTAGRVIDMNGVAENLTGWKREDAAGRPSREVFRILKGGSREEAADPVGRCLATGETTGLEDRTLLVARDGTERRIADSCAPIYDEEKRLLGGVLVFRDVSDAWKREELLADISAKLTERVKELQCLYGIGRLVSDADLTFRDVFEQSLGLITAGMQYPEIAFASIAIGENRFSTPNYEESPWMLSGPISSEGLRIGSLEVGYLEYTGEGDPFLPEEKELFETITEQLNLFVERRYSILALRQSEERYRSIFDQGVDGICLADAATGIITDCNRAFSDLLGYSRLDLLGKKQKMIHPPSPDDGPLSPTFLAHRKERQGDVLETKVLTADGRLIDVEIQASIVRYHNRDILQGVFRDISARKMAQSTLKMRGRLLDSIGQAVIVAGLDGIITYANRAVERVFGWKAEELAGKSTVEVLSAEDMEKYARSIMEQLNAGETWSGEFRLRRKDGSSFDAIVSDTPVRDEAGNLTAIIGITTDITEQKAAGRRIAALLDEKELLLREVNHRIKNNMFTVMGMLTLQAEFAEEEGLATRLRDASGRLRSMLVLYDRLYRSERHDGLSLRTYIEALLEEVSTVLQGQTAISIRTDVEDIVLDAGALSRIGIIVNELFTNSVKYAFDGRGKGEIAVTAFLHEGKLTIRYSDNGTGLPSTVRPENSPGFGLQLVSMLCGQMEAALRVETGGGTSFIIEFDPEAGREP